MYVGYLRKKLTEKITKPTLQPSDPGRGITHESETLRTDGQLVFHALKITPYFDFDDARRLRKQRILEDQAAATDEHGRTFLVQQ
jgi:hypothetical protein